MTRRLRCFWEEESIWLCFELDTDGSVIRQVELAERPGTALTAASLAEWPQACGEGWSAEYEQAYGMTAEPTISKWDWHDPQWLSAEDFEDVWSDARAHQRQLARTGRGLIR
jgi:hypothetical protein